MLVDAFPTWWDDSFNGTHRSQFAGFIVCLRLQKKKKWFWFISILYLIGNRVYYYINFSLVVASSALEYIHQNSVFVCLFVCLLVYCTSLIMKWRNDMKIKENLKNDVDFLGEIRWRWRRRSRAEKGQGSKRELCKKKKINKLERGLWNCKGVVWKIKVKKESYKRFV